MFHFVLTHYETNVMIIVRTQNETTEEVKQMPSNTRIGERLKNLRRKRGLTQKEVSKMAKISVAAVTNYEAGKRIPRDEVKIKLAKIYGSTVEDIFFK